MYKFTLVFFMMVLLKAGANGQQEQSWTYKLEEADNLIHFNVQSEPVMKDGLAGIKVIRSEAGIEDETLVILPDVSFHNGIIELELSGERLSEADPNMRGFVGLAFRIDPDDYRNYECIYLRPENGRAPEQLRRNHSTQYISHPDYPWYKLRQESPGVYESYVDLVPGAWTRMKVVVEDLQARLYVDDADQPCLVINDLKKGDRSGLVGLWLHASTRAHYRDLKITHTD